MGRTAVFNSPVVAAGPRERGGGEKSNSYNVPSADRLARADGSVVAGQGEEGVKSEWL